MKIVVSGASGLIGRPLVARLRGDGHDVVQLVRREPRSAHEVRWDPATGHLDPSALEGVEGAVNLSGAGVGDKRWSSGYKRVIRDSRVDSTRTLATALAALDPLPSVLLNGSAIGYYGDRGDTELTEQSSAGDGFLAGVVVEWEAATRPAEDAGVRTAHLRTGLVMSRKGGAFGRLFPLFRLGLGGRLGSGSMWWSWITLEDEVAAITHLLTHDVSGPVNLTGPRPVTNAEFTKALGRAMHRPAPFAVPTLALRAGLGEFADEVTSSQRVLPHVLLDSGFTFSHQDVDSACRWLAGR
jgi:uncharacterized protein (TIGR01777 family)